MISPKVGFTGTQIGMSLGQKKALKFELGKIFLSQNVEGMASELPFERNSIEFHHGDCVGADEEAHEIAMWLGCEIILHPPFLDYKRAFCWGAKRTEEKKDYLARNHDIVDACDILIVAPKMNVEELRSGTWATYRYAMKKGRKIIMLEREDSV